MNNSNGITEINLDDIASNAVAIEKVDDKDFNKSDMKTSESTNMIENVAMDYDLDLLVDPNKSLQNSPKPSNTTTSVNDDATHFFENKPKNDDKISDNKNKPIPEKNFEIGEEKINFTMNVERSALDDNSHKEKDNSKAGINFNERNFTKHNREEQVEKQDLLFKLKRLESRGIPLSSHFSISSRLSDMKEEYERIKKQRDLENSLKFQRKTMMAFTSGVEFMNSKFDPFDIKLDGWSESLHENISDYDDVFEELHEKYKTKAKIAPELKLLMMLGGSAAMFHMTNSFFKSAMPSMDDVLKQNPDLARQFANAAVSSATQNNPGLGNVMGDMINETMNARQSHQNQEFNNSNLNNISFSNEQNNNLDVMSGPDDKDVERILHQINEYREEENSNKFANNFLNQIPVKEYSVNNSPISQASSVTKDISEEVRGKKRRGRPPKVKPNTESFSLNI